MTRVSPLDREITRNSSSAHYVHYQTWDGALCTAGVAPFVIRFSLNMKAWVLCFLVGCVTSCGHIKFSLSIYIYILCFYSQVKDACFHWWARFLLLSRLQQYIVLMRRDLYRPDACLYSTQREDLAWGRYYSSFSDRAKRALLSTVDYWYHNTQFYFKATKHST